MKPDIHKSSYVDDTAVIIGNVKIGKKCGIYPNTVIRGDQNLIEIQEGSNIQDGCVLHTNQKHKVKIGKNVSLGHACIVHGANIEENCIIGMNATILNGAKIRKGTIVGANAVVTENMETPENSLLVGVPAKVIKENEEKFRKQAYENALKYQKLSKEYKEGKHKRI
ncbi:MAG: gamma carbonic anhydrase family protein [Candidatus Thermoplasmatota archaeon]